MKLSIAVLCDRATVREGLLHILGAGISTVTFALPGKMPLDLAIYLTLDDPKPGEHWLTTELYNEDTGETVGSIRAQFVVPDKETRSSDSSGVTLPVSIPLQSLVVAKAGPHHVKLLLDDQELTSIPLLVRGRELEDDEIVDDQETEDDQK